MSQAVSAYQNLVDDFGWVPPATAWLANIAIIFGVVLAVYQLDAWRREAAWNRRFERALKLLSLVNDAQFALINVRSFDVHSLMSGGIKGAPLLEWKKSRLASYNQLFEELRREMTLYGALVDDRETTFAVLEILKIRRQIENVIIAIPFLENREGEEGIKTELDAMWKLLNSSTDEDEVSNKINDVVKTVSRNLTPLLQLKGWKK